MKIGQEDKRKIGIIVWIISGVFFWPTVFWVGYLIGFPYKWLFDFIVNAF